jgi:hypothetical protein
MFALETIFVPLLILALFCVVDHAINRQVAETVVCPYCEKPVPGSDLMKPCNACGRQVCPFCRIYDGEALCQDCYIATRIREDG